MFYRKPQVIKGILSDKERRYIITLAEDKLEDSKITTGKIVNESIRKSKTAWLSKNDPIVDRIIRKCIKYTDKHVTNFEKLQVLKYEKNGHYKYHQDCFIGDKNKRIHTFILALNDDYDGGETHFPHINKSYKLSAGDALFFDTLNKWECMSSKALHGGLPVKSGEKWICNLWVRKYPYLF
jgi:predicted 2-oxoglutarate/Fe(II)-dependent dioxygenase YbiX|tara:strand:- start:305 stop:847 length:543 start_codon:yes stop_codon:yes gene_type:complete